MNSTALASGRGCPCSRCLLGRVVYLEFDACFPQHLFGKRITVGVLKNEFNYTAVDEHLGTDGAGLMGNINRGVPDRHSVIGGLNNRILFGVKAPAQLVPLTRRDIVFDAQACIFSAVGYAGGHPVIAGGEYALVLYDDRSDAPAQACGSGGDVLGNFHEIRIP